ncbi:hypothetical protein E2562_017321 [Oryza meyeriana var. granulata]|uniref:Uncharacterized protein n=1 Tax=Oryza meyeriana var. granulata TaxID=110450 RepID=A0A6G1BXK2_9ORYZ|nr:hypothetical protein E2562_017321 [Oryza meyeriana var. granulata]
MHRIAQLREGLTSMMVIGDFLWWRLVPLQRCSCLAWFYTGDRDVTKTHVGLRRHPCQRATQEDLALRNDLGRVSLQAILPKSNARGILERVFRRAPRSVHIPAVDGDEARQGGGAAQAPGPML